MTIREYYGKTRAKAQTRAYNSPKLMFVCNSNKIASILSRYTICQVNPEVKKTYIRNSPETIIQTPLKKPAFSFQHTGLRLMQLISHQRSRHAGYELPDITT